MFFYCYIAVHRWFTLVVERINKEKRKYWRNFLFSKIKCPNFPSFFFKKKLYYKKSKNKTLQSSLYKSLPKIIYQFIFLAFKCGNLTKYLQKNVVRQDSIFSTFCTLAQLRLTNVHSVHVGMFLQSLLLNCS